MIAYFYLLKPQGSSFPIAGKEAKDLGRVRSNYLYLKTLSSAG